MLKRIERLLPHAAILICNMYVVFFLIDRVNPAMNFIDNRLTKGLLFLLCAVSALNARSLLRRPTRFMRPAPDRRAGTASPRPGERRASSPYIRRQDGGRPYDDRRARGSASPARARSASAPGSGGEWDRHRRASYGGRSERGYRGDDGRGVDRR